MHTFYYSIHVDLDSEKLKNMNFASFISGSSWATISSRVFYSSDECIIHAQEIMEEYQNKFEHPEDFELITEYSSFYYPNEEEVFPGEEQGDDVVCQIRLYDYVDQIDVLFAIVTAQKESSEPQSSELH